MRNKYMFNSKVNDSREVGEESDMLMTNEGYRETHACIIVTTLLYYSHSEINGNNIHKGHEQDKKCYV